MLTRIIVSVVMMFGARVAACAESELQPLTPYALPAAAEQPIKELADRSDVLILGESHGSKEVPEIVAALLPALSKMGYQVLALEVPSDQQAALTDWATGKTQTLPSFYAKPMRNDGRANQQMLSLIRMALSPPYRWKLICFDVSQGDEPFTSSQHLIEEYVKKAGDQAVDKDGTIHLEKESDLTIAIWQKRDATMAANFEKQRKQFASQGKVLAICGNQHARTANPPDSNDHWWPSFAAVLQSSQPGKSVSSIDVNPKSGYGVDDRKVNDLGGKTNGEAEAHWLENANWNLKLNLPHATAATFLGTSIDPDVDSASATTKNPTK
jgi:hypothetical protein